MEKVFVLVGKFTYDYEEEVTAEVYSTIEKARKALKDTLEEEIEDSWLNRYVDENGKFDDDVVVDEGKDSIDIYPDGNASEYETHLYIQEKEVM